MDLKDGAIALAGSCLLFLVLGFFTGSLIFYAFFSATLAALAADYFRYASVRHDLGRKLRVKKQLSRSEISLGSSFTITYHLDYAGRRPLSVQCRQPAVPSLGGLSKQLDLQSGSQAIQFEATPAGRGSYTIEGLSLTFESLLFRGTMTRGDAMEVHVYPMLDVHPGRTSDRKAQHYNIGNETTRGGSGIDFSHIRPYVPGDSTRNIDWARSSKSGLLVVKEYEDVRSMPLFILIDVDQSMETGTEKTELESALELATLLSGKALLENERVGIACFSSSDVVACRPIAAGKPQLAHIRQLLASVSTVHGTPGPRYNAPGMYEAAAAQKVFSGVAGADDVSSIMEEALRQFSINVREDGLIKSITRASQSQGVPCHIVIITNLSMGMGSLLNGLRIARYYGHTATVALTPHIWYEPKEGADAEKYFRMYRETAENIARLRSSKVDVIELSAAERPEEAMLEEWKRRSTRTCR